MIELKAPLPDASVCLQTPAQKAFIEEEDIRAKMDGSFTFRWYDLKMQGVDRTAPLPVSFVWEEIAEENVPKNAYFYLLISESEDMQQPWTYMTMATSLDVYNLKIGTRYFWCVQKNGVRSEVLSFQTQATLPRCLKIDCISNVRDFGGYPVKGGRIRQGLVYRGGETELHMQLAPQGAEELHRLGMRTELDMRAGKENLRTSFEGIGIKRILAPGYSYHEVFEKEKIPTLKSFFKVIADPKNYPLYFHCWGGADRTGTYAFILGAFLGMSFEDLIYDYEFTSLAIWGIRSRNYTDFLQFLDLLKALPGDTLQEQCRSFLKQYARLTDKQLETIYTILVEKE